MCSLAGIIAKVSHCLPFNTLITPYHALVHLQLLYALPIWAFPYKTYLNKLEKLQSFKNNLSNAFM